MKKSYKHRILQLIIPITISLVLLLCYKYHHYLSQINSNVDFDDKIIEKIEKDNAKQVNYMLFYTDNLGIAEPKTITLYFSPEIKKYNIEKVRLLQNQKILPEEVFIEKEATVNNKVEILLPKYISAFNKAEFTLNTGKAFVVNTGQFYFEKFPYIKNTLNDNEKYEILKFDNLLNDNYFYCDYVLKKGIESNLEIFNNLDFKNVGCIQTINKIKETPSDVTYRYEARISKDYFEKNNLNNISFETALIQKEIQGTKSNILTKVFIPLSKP